MTPPHVGAGAEVAAVVGAKVTPPPHAGAGHSDAGELEEDADTASVATHASVADNTDGSGWYQLRIMQPPSMPSTSPEHLMCIMYKIIESKACAVKKYISTIVLEANRPVLYMVIHVNKNTIQTHFIQRWNNNEKSAFTAKKIRRNDAIMRAFNDVTSVAVSPELVSYRDTFQTAIPKSVVWGTLTTEYIKAYMGV